MIRRDVLDFLDANNLSIRCGKHFDGNGYYITFSRPFTCSGMYKDGPILEGIYGSGHTFEEALEATLKCWSGKVAVFDSHDENGELVRETVQFPLFIGSIQEYEIPPVPMPIVDALAPAPVSIEFDLSCKKGDLVWCVYRGIGGWKIAKHTIVGIKIKNDGVHFIWNDSGYPYQEVTTDEVLGDRAFLFEHEAKQKLKKLKSTTIKLEDV